MCVCVGEGGGGGGGVARASPKCSHADHEQVTVAMKISS